jgi:hypothetical protein
VHIVRVYFACLLIFIKVKDTISVKTINSCVLMLVVDISVADLKTII